MSTKKKTTRKKATKKELPIWPHQVQGGKYVKILQRFMKKLRDEDTENANGNQKLFLDDVIIAYLLTFFNASIKSLRTIEDFSQTKQGQKHLSIRKICRSTLSEFNALANPERLKPLIHALREGLDKTQFKGNKKDRDLSSLIAQAVAVDGTLGTQIIVRSSGRNAVREPLKGDDITLIFTVTKSKEITYEIIIPEFSR